jgi:hypothetical protein
MAPLFVWDATVYITYSQILERYHSYRKAMQKRWLGDAELYTRMTGWFGALWPVFFATRGLIRPGPTA